MTTPFSFERRARQPRGIAIVSTAVLCLVLLGVVFAAHPLILAAVAAVTAPAAWEIATDARAQLDLTDEALTWSTGARHGAVALDRIDEAQLATRMDFSQRAHLRLTDGRTLRLPGACLPPGRILDVALTARGVKVRRRLF